MQLTDGNVTIRTMVEQDFPLLLKWLTDPRVLRFYGGRDTNYTPETLAAHYSEAFESDGFRTIIEYRQQPIGYGQVYRVCGEMFWEYHYPQTKDVVYAMDQFIGEPSHWNKGIGTHYVQMICAYLKAEKHASAVILDPHADNARAIRAYQKAGFCVIGALPQHELFEGKKADCLLMECRL